MPPICRFEIGHCDAARMLAAPNVFITNKGNTSVYIGYLASNDVVYFGAPSQVIDIGHYMQDPWRRLNNNKQAQFTTLQKAFNSGRCKPSAVEYAVVTTAGVFCTPSTDLENSLQWFFAFGTQALPLLAKGVQAGGKTRWARYADLKMLADASVAGPAHYWSDIFPGALPGTGLYNRLCIISKEIANCPHVTLCGGTIDPGCALGISGRHVPGTPGFGPELCFRQATAGDARCTIRGTSASKRSLTPLERWVTKNL
jgi:hypothetical protein